MKLTLEEIIQATGAEIIKNNLKLGEKFTFSTDTRSIENGEIYLPLKGENFNGEDFIEKALEAGAAGYFYTDETKCEKQKSNGKIVLKVADTLAAYLELARFCRRKTAPITVAVTGSCGKTTTKEMLYCVISKKFKTHKSELNFNNEIGMSKTILSMPEDTQALILEMGMRGLGEIETLSKYSEPDISVITNVGTAHIGRLKNRENIAKAKCEITLHQNPKGTFIAQDDELIKNTVQFGGEKIYFSLKNAEILEQEIGYSKFKYKNHIYSLNVEGEYNIKNALAAIETGLKLGITPEDIASGLKNYSPIEKRWEVVKKGGFKIINDSYNANPESMKAAIKTALDTAQKPLLLVLGDMGELGENEIEYHREIGDFLTENLKDSGNVKIITVGKLACEISKILEKTGLCAIHFDDNSLAARYIVENAQSGTTIMLKASRSMKFEEIADKLDNEE